MDAQRAFARLRARSLHEDGSSGDYINVTLLDGEFTSGPNNGKVPAYAPEYQVKTGLMYSYKNTFKLAMLGTLVDDEFGDDGDSFEGFIPAYNVWDLTAEFRFWKGEPECSRVSGTFSTKVIGAKSARKAS